MLVADGERKAACYIVSNLHGARLGTKRAIAGTAETQAFLKDMGQLGDDIRTGVESLPQADANEELQKLDAALSSAQFDQINKEFEQYKASRRGGEPQWYKVAGKNNIRDVAIELRKLPEYIIYYAQESEVVHSASYSDHVKILVRGARASPVRDLTGTHNLFNAAASIALILFQRVLGFYRPRELPRFGQQYLEDWRPAYRNIPRAVITER